MQVTNKATGEAYFVGQFDMLGAILEKLQLGPQNASITFDAHEAAQYAGIYIERFYPVYRQLNILRAGSKAERDQMDMFIEACRAWANSAAHALSDVTKIVP